MDKAFSQLVGGSDEQIREKDNQVEMNISQSIPIYRLVADAAAAAAAATTIWDMKLRFKWKFIQV